MNSEKIVIGLFCMCFNGFGIYVNEFVLFEN